MDRKNVCEGTTTIRDPRLWSAETPSLYTVQLELLDAAGNVLEATSQQYGFRKIEIRNNKVYINNALILLKEPTGMTYIRSLEKLFRWKA